MPYKCNGCENAVIDEHSAFCKKYKKTLQEGVYTEQFDPLEICINKNKE